MRIITTIVTLLGASVLAVQARADENRCQWRVIAIEEVRTYVAPFACPIYNTPGVAYGKNYITVHRVTQQNSCNGEIKVTQYETSVCRAE